MGKLDGSVRGSDQDSGSWTVVIQKGPSTREIKSDDNGHFVTKLPAGVYTAYVKTANVNRRSERIPFLVEPNATTIVELDPVSQSALCSAANKRIIPVPMTDSPNDALARLHHQHYDSFRVKISNNESLQLVIGYCGKTQTSTSISYESAAMAYNTLRLSADKAMFDLTSRKLKAWDKVTVRQHGKAVEVAQVEADFRGGRPIISLTGEPIRTSEGYGALDSAAASFRFKINDDGTATFTYVDDTKGLKLVSRKHDLIVIAKASKEGMTFGGSAAVSGAGSLVSKSARIVDFMVTVSDFGPTNKREDVFTISIPALNNYKESGHLTTGDIQISHLLKDKSVAGVRTPR
jgi:hypothetical protein